MSADETTATPLDLDAILRAADPTTPEAWSQKMRDQAFVIHAREDVPDLVAEVRRLRARVAALTTELDDTAAELLEAGERDDL